MRDILERASARETAARVAVGAVLIQFLEAVGISITSRVREIGGADTDEAIQSAIEQAMSKGDTLGGVLE